MSDAAPAVALLAGFDPTGGAGLLRDAWTVASVTGEVEPEAPVQVRAVVTVLTEQGHGRPARAGPVEPSEFARRVARLEPDANFRPASVKVGLVPAGLVTGTIAALEVQRTACAAIVVDPVLRATDGGDLGGTPEGYARLATIATLLTPNWAEARALLDAVRPAVNGPGQAAPDLGGHLAGALGCAVLLKGGHAPDTEGDASEGGATVTDTLWTPEGDRARAWTRRRVVGPDVRGTGCALSSAIATRLALGDALPDAVGAAIAWLDAARRSARPGGDAWHLPAPGFPRLGR